MYLESVGFDLSDRRGVVRGGIVHEQYAQVDVRSLHDFDRLLDFREHRADRVRLVVRRQHDEPLHPLDCTGQVVRPSDHAWSRTRLAKSFASR